MSTQSTPKIMYPVLSIVLSLDKEAYPENLYVIQFSADQLKIVSMRSEKPTCASPRLSEVSPILLLKRFQCSPD